ncbi:MAG: hypothetical protein AAGH92_07325, partial [Planctomycetota bacterium]
VFVCAALSARVRVVVCVHTRTKTETPTMKADIEITHITPNTLAAERRIRVHTILKWIDSGELEAVDHRSPGTSRPAWKISREAIARFDSRRSNTPTPPPATRRKRKAQPARQWV